MNDTIAPVTPAKYHPALVVLHWVLAFMIVADLYFGAARLAVIPNNAPLKLTGLRVHMTEGLVILFLMVVRLLIRGQSRRPAAARAGLDFFDQLARISHRALYVAVFAMAAMGITLALQAGLFPIVYGGEGELPPTLWVYWARTAHYVLSRILMGLIALHVTGALYHTLVRRDRLLARMWFGNRWQKN